MQLCDLCNDAIYCDKLNVIIILDSYIFTSIYLTSIMLPLSYYQLLYTKATHF